MPFSVPLLETPIIISCLFFLTGFSRRLDHRSDHRPPAVFAVANLKGDFFKQTVWKAQECSHLLILSKERGVTTSGCGYFLLLSYSLFPTLQPSSLLTDRSRKAFHTDPIHKEHSPPKTFIYYFQRLLSMAQPRTVLSSHVPTPDRLKAPCGQGSGMLQSLKVDLVRHVGSPLSNM